MLSTIAVASYSGYIRQARMQEAIAFLGAIRIRQELYFQSYSQYVDTGDDSTTPSFYPYPIWENSACDDVTQWSIDCSTAAAPGANAQTVGFCTLGVELIGDARSYFQYLSFGWEPGDTADSNCSSKLCLVPDVDRPWWVAIAQGDQRCDYRDGGSPLKSLAIVSSQLRNVVQFDIGEGSADDDWGAASLPVQDLDGGF